MSSLIGNERIKKLLQRAVAERRIGQSLLMTGPRGVGKYQFAIALAQALNCERPSNGDACGKCIPCRKIAGGEHADVQTFTNEGTFIKVDKMRDMSRDAQYKPYEGRHRVCIIDEADRMNLPSANSILKTLEEPPESTLIVLVTANPYRLPDTIRSRCQILNFAGLTAREIEEHLSTKANRPAEEARLLARLARGSIGHALEINLDAYRQSRDRMLELIETLALSREVNKLLSASEYLGRKLEKDEFEHHLDAMMVLLSDLLYLKLSAGAEALTNADIIERLEIVAGKLTIEQITDWVDQIEEIFKAMPRNINRQLAMDAMLMA
ncbi:MAG TPA: DNA polymerase III subunit delta' [Blastocatellia bacterium]|nr:DNA polymerase III subunit delta' [Blastocatellia bacterium]